MSATIPRAKDALMAEQWPALPFADWHETCTTLHMWTQIIGKVRLALSPPRNHWWQVPLYLTARGMTTSPIPYQHGSFEVQLDFIDHNLSIFTDDGTNKLLPLLPRSVAAFYQEFLASLAALGIQVQIHPLPCEVPNPIPFDQDERHASYDPNAVSRFWRILLQTEQVLKVYQGHFLGKSSPIHFFWGSFDLAVTRFSGRRAPERPGADKITREAYSHEVISCGFWPGNASFPQSAFYSYTAPVPDGLSTAAIKPAGAFYDPKLAEFLLLYDSMRTMPDPAQALLDFAQSTYVAGAELAHWDRAALER